MQRVSAPREGDHTVHDGRHGWFCLWFAFTRTVLLELKRHTRCRRNQELKESRVHARPCRHSNGRGEYRCTCQKPNVHLRKSLFPPFPPAAPEPLPTPEKFQQGRSYVAYIPVPIGGSDEDEDEDDEDEYEDEDDEYEDDDYYDEDEEDEYYYEDDDDVDRDYDDDYDYEDDEDVGVGDETLCCKKGFVNPMLHARAKVKIVNPQFWTSFMDGE